MGRIRSASLTLVGSMRGLATHSLLILYLIAERYEAAATIVTSNLDFAETSPACSGLAPPGGGLGGVQTVLLGDLGECQIASQCVEGDLGLEARRMVSAGSFHRHYSFRSV